MKLSTILIIICILIFGNAVVHAQRVFSLNMESLLKVRNATRENSKEYKDAYKKLLRDAEKSLAVAPVSVMDKDQTPSSGDKHDYMSLGRYFWPDPTKPDGLPYINKDGETNPEVETITDRKNIEVVSKNSWTLALAYFFSGEEKYAEKATSFLRTWFLNPETKMNPNLNFGQMVKGKEGGRPSGLIETRCLTQIVDVVGFLAGSKSWTEADQQGITSWFEQYFQWLNENSIGVKESATTNNHGTWLRGQKISIALFLNKKDIATQLSNEAKEKVIATQITPEGEQPRESARTRSLHYTHFNLQAMFTLASLAKSAGVDLWNYQTEDGRSIKRALDWVLPVVTGDKKWEKQQIDEFDMSRFYEVLTQASVEFKDEKYAEIASDIGGENAKKEQVNLFFVK